MAKAINILVHTALWKRPEVTKVFFEQLFAVEKELKHHNINLRCIAVVSTPDDKRLALNHRAKVVEAPNSPLGAKLNAGIEAAKRLKFDYLLSVGSDDVFNTDYVLNLLKHAKQGFGVVGCRDIWFYTANNQKVMYWQGYTNHRRGESVGAGRLTSRETLKTLDWKLWSDTKNKSVDFAMQKRLKAHSIKTTTFSALEEGGRLLDIKTPTNLTPIVKFNGINCRVVNFFEKHFTVDLLNDLRQL